MMHRLVLNHILWRYENHAVWSLTSFKNICFSGVTFGNSEIPGGWSTRKQLYCKTRYNLAIDETGNVYGTKEPYSPNGKFISVTLTIPGLTTAAGEFISQ